MTFSYRQPAGAKNVVVVMKQKIFRRFPRTRRFYELQTELPCRINLFDVRFWPKADIGYCTAHVCFRGQSGHDRLRMSAFAVAIGGKADMGWCSANVRL